MIIKVGEKVKALRKALNMTQSELAGSEMTKSMLSQIENNISNPSMKTLQYLAGKLNKPISYFLEDEDNFSPEFLKHDEKFNIELENKIKHINKLIASNEMSEPQKELEELINNSCGKKTKRYADIFLKFGSKLINLNRLEDAKKYINISLDTYIKENLYLDASKAYVELGKAYYEEFNYEESLKICQKAFDLYYKNINPDSSFEIELYYYKILFLSALGYVSDTLEFLKTAINISTKTSIYYKTDELYRLNGIFAYLTGDIIEYENSIKKALEFAKFSENKYCLCGINIILATVALDSNMPEKALKYAEAIKHYSKTLDTCIIKKGAYLYHLLKGRAYYILNQYELAYENIVKVNFPTHVKHKFDYLNMWSAKIYEGLILNKLGKKTDGINSIKIGIEKMSFFDKSKFLANAYKSLSEVYSEIGDFENAFIALRKASEIQELINNDTSIVF